MASMFDYDDSVNLAYNAKIAGKNLIAAKHELLNKTGEFLFLAHSDREFALRCQMIEQDIEGVAYRRLASLSDSKAKLVRAAFDEWQLRHASCGMCKTASDRISPECNVPGCNKSSFDGYVCPTHGGKPPTDEQLAATRKVMRDRGLLGDSKTTMASKTAAGPKVVEVPAPNRPVVEVPAPNRPVVEVPAPNRPVVQVQPVNRQVVEVPGRTQKLVPVVRGQSTQVPSLDMHHDACSPTGCHPECRIKLPPTGVQSQIHL